MNPYDLPIDRRRPEPHSEGPKPEGEEYQRIESAVESLTVATAEAVLQWFIDNDGLAEQPDGSNHVPGVTDRCGLGNVAWCAEAVSVALMAGGFGSLDGFFLEMPGFWTDYRWGWAYCPNIVTAFRDAGRWHLSEPLPGDVVLFDWDGDNWADHVGIVEQDLGDGTVLTREGNADNRVGQHRRSALDILGYGRPPYATEEEDDLDADAKAKIDAIYDYIEGTRKGELDHAERFTAQVLTEHKEAVTQAGDGDTGLGWRKFVATLKGVRRPKA